MKDITVVPPTLLAEKIEQNDQNMINQSSHILEMNEASLLKRVWRFSTMSMIAKAIQGQCSGKQQLENVPAETSLIPLPTAKLESKL